MNIENLESESFSIFTESSESKGILFNSYKFLNDRIKQFLDVIEKGVNDIKKDPIHNNVNIRDDISKFKSDIDRKYTPSFFNIRNIDSMKKSINSFRNESLNILKRYASIRYKMAYGGNYVHGILQKGKVYSKDINPEHYSKINNNIRNVDRALDWVEKILLDLFNMIDQDLNLLTIINMTYKKRKIYESVTGEYDTCIILNENNIYDPPLSYDQLPDHLKNDPVHVWRAKTGIELIHKEPTIEELQRIWNNWNLMADEQKRISDEKSIELFGVDNKTHYEQLITEYESIKENKTVDDNLGWIGNYIMEEGEDPIEEPPSIDENPDEKQSMPKQTDAKESSKNGVRRKKLYIAFIEWAKEYNSRNTFGSIFDKDIFNETYSFVPNEMRYFYRLANPILCVLSANLTFFQVSELRKLNAKNDKMNELLIFAATPNDMRVFNAKDKKIYRGVDENGSLLLKETIGDTFDLYIQNMIKKGDILNGPIEEYVDMEYLM